MPDEHQRWSELIAAAVTDSLTAAEADELGAHIAQCAACERDLRELSSVTEALHAIDTTSESSVDGPQPDLADRVVAAVEQARRQHHRRQRFRYAVAASAACLGFLGLGLTLGQPSGPPQEPVAIAADEGIDADVALVVHTWGTEVKLVVSGLAQGETYGVTVVSEDGTRVPAGTFLGVSDRPIVCDMNAAVPREDAAALEVVNASGDVVMAAEL